MPCDHCQMSTRLPCRQDSIRASPSRRSWRAARSGIGGIKAPGIGLAGSDERPMGSKSTPGRPNRPRRGSGPGPDGRGPGWRCGGGARARAWWLSLGCRAAGVVPCDIEARPGIGKGIGTDGVRTRSPGHGVVHPTGRGGRPRAGWPGWQSRSGEVGLPIRRPVRPDWTTGRSRWVTQSVPIRGPCHPDGTSGRPDEGQVRDSCLPGRGAGHPARP